MDQIICGLVSCVHTYKGFAYFGGYDTFTYLHQYLVLFQLLLHFWGYLCYDLRNWSCGSSVYGEGAATFVSYWYSSNINWHSRDVILY